MTDVARLAGRRVFVTGGGSGIGRASALRVAAEGGAVAVTDISPDSARAVADEITAAGGTAIGLAVDVGDDDAVKAAVDDAAERLGGLDGLAACAGIAHPGSTLKMPFAAWETMLRVNLTGVYSAIRHSVAHLDGEAGASIVTIGSVASLVAAGHAVAYDASKGGVLQLTRAIAVEFADRGIRANCVCPGKVRTGLRANSRAVASHAESSGDRRAAADRIDVPIAGYAEPEAIAAAVAYLLSDDASFVTGIALPVDGGYTAI